MPKYGNSAPDPSKIENFDFFMFTSTESLIRFQRALNHYLGIILIQYMPKNVFLAQNAQIWSFGPRPLKNLRF